jgi:phage baseplate assembly protein W
MATDKFLGCQYPLAKTPRGIMAQKTGVDQIKADMLQLLLTNPGERTMLPAFGTALRTLVFDQNDSTLESRARDMISKSILMWEPRIVVSNITVTSKIPLEALNARDSREEQGGILYINIAFIDPEDISQIQNLKLEVPLGGA